jgi:hypothetical protein
VTHGWPAALVTGSSNKRPFPQPNWDLKYRSGSLALKKDQWFKAAFISGPVPEQPPNPALVISADQVRGIYFDPKAQKDSDTVQHMPRSGCGYAKDLMPKDKSASPPDLFVAWRISPGTIARTAGHLNAQYPVRLVWNDNNVEKEALFNVQYCDYASFIANLRWFAGPRWKDVGQEIPR